MTALSMRIVLIWARRLYHTDPILVNTYYYLLTKKVGTLLAYLDFAITA